METFSYIKIASCDLKRIVLEETCHFEAVEVISTNQTLGE
jgi:hypothetical protein